jgi:hypothetical protein
MKAFSLPTTLAVALISLPLAFRNITSRVGDIRIRLHRHGRRSPLGQHASKLPQFPSRPHNEGGPLCVHINGHRLVLGRGSL